MEKNKLKFIKDDVLKINQHIDFSEIKNKKILITGATGLVGLYFLLSLKDSFEDNNIDITIIHNSDIDDIFNVFIDFKKINCIQSDITDVAFLEKELGSYDFIIHAAGYGQPKRFLEDRLKTIELNTSVTSFLIKRLNEGGKFLFISSSEVYSGLNKDQVESSGGSTTPYHNRACYIEGKICGETICNIYREMGKDIKVARLSLTYGPGTKVGDKRMLTNFIEKGLVNKKIDLIDSGDSIRTLLYVADAVIIMWNILFKSKDILYNVGGDTTESIYNLAKIIAEKLEVEVSRPSVEDKLVGSPEFVKVSMSKYYNEFEEIELNSLTKGVENTISWQKEIYGK